MNEKNYGSLEACQRLQAAGILKRYPDIGDRVLVDFKGDISREGFVVSVWRTADSDVAVEFDSSIGAIFVKDEQVHILYSMAEVWRELPSFITEENIAEKKILTAKKMPFGITDVFFGDTCQKLYSSENSTDALISLLIWVKEQKGKERP